MTITEENKVRELLKFLDFLLSVEISPDERNMLEEIKKHVFQVWNIK